jgi:drug/metabolite transporter (DMT)-like permease
MKTIELFLLLLLSAVWGASFLFMRIAAPEFGVIVLIFLRICIALLVLSPLFFSLKIRQEIRENFHHLLVLGLFNTALPFCLIAWTTLSIEAGLTSLLISATPLFAAVIGHIKFKVHLAPRQWFGLFVGVIGVLIFSWQKLSFREGGSGFAILSGLFAAFLFASAALYVDRYLKNISAQSISLGSLSAAFFLLMIPGIHYWPQVLPSIPAWIAVFGLAIFGTSFAYLLYFYLMKKVGAMIATTITWINPLFAVAWGMIILGEQLTITIVIGMVITFFGAYLVDSKS